MKLIAPIFLAAALADDSIEIGKAWGLKGLEAEVRRRIESGAPQSGT